MDEHDIREWVKERLLDATEAGSRVYNTRGMNLQDIELPAINIVTPSESITDAHVLTTRLEIHAFHAIGDDELLGQKITGLKKEIRTALFRFHESVGALASRYVGSDLRFTMTPERPHAVCRLLYDIDTLDEE